MKQFKAIIYEIIILFQQFVMWIPFWPIRWIWLKLTLKKMGKHTYVSRYVDIRKPSNVILGENCVINKSTLLDGRGGILQIGDNVDVAQECMIWTLTHDVNSSTHATKHNNTYIENYVWLCTRCIILPGVTVQKGAVVGAGSVIHKDVESMAVVSGNPFRIIKMRDNNLSYNLKHKKIFL